MSEPITDLPVADSIDPVQDTFPIVNNGLDETQQINRNVFLEITGDPLGTTDVQTVTNKTIGTTNSITQLDNVFTLKDNSDTTKQAQFQLSGITTATTRTFTFPDANATLVGTATTQTLTNKTLTSPTITGGSITNSTISVDSIAEYTAGNGVTIDGLNIKDSKLNTNNSVVTANITDTAVTPAKLQSGTGSSWQWQSWTPTWNTITVGNGLQDAKYIQIGKTVFYRLYLRLGTTSSVGTSPSFTLPVTSVALTPPSYVCGWGTILDSGVAVYEAFAVNASATVAQIRLSNSSSTYSSLPDSITSSVPMTWGVDDSIYMTGFYETV